MRFLWSWWVCKSHAATVFLRQKVLRVYKYWLLARKLAGEESFDNSVFLLYAIISVCFI